MCIRDRSYFIPCALPSCVQPIEIMVLLCAVQREAYEEREMCIRDRSSSIRTSWQADKKPS